MSNDSLNLGSSADTAPDERNRRHDVGSYGESLEDLYEHATCGFLSMVADTTIVKLNRTLSDWIGRDAVDVVGTRMHALLTPGGRIYLETHLMPLLTMQGHVRQISLDLVRVGRDPMPVLIDAERRSLPPHRVGANAHEVIRVTFVDITDRRTYERELLEARRQAEEALAQVRTLRGLFPVCAWCRKIRGDDGYWQQLEEYIRTHTDADVTHGMCTECRDEHMPEM